MSMSVSPVVAGSGGGFDPSKMASKIASKMMSDLDPNNTGTVTKDQFVSGLTAIGVSSAEATKMFDAIDANKTGNIGKSDIEAAVKNGKLKTSIDSPQAGTHKAGGRPGGAGKPGGASTTSTNYAAADTNQDGVVSVQEAAIYAMKHPSVSTTDKTKTDPSKLGKNVDKLV